MTDRAAWLVGDLERIPGLLRAQASLPAPKVDVDGIERIVLSGLGSSRFAAMAVLPAFVAAGWAASVEFASTPRPQPLDRRSMLMAISSSGSTPETVAAAVRARHAGARVVAITNAPGSPLAAAAAVTLDLGAGIEPSGIAVITYAVTVATLVRLAAAGGAPVDAPRVINAAVGLAEEVFATRGAWLDIAADALAGGAAVHVIADATGLGTAEQSALLLREGPRLEADATDAGDWQHVAIYTALPGYRAVLLAGTPYDGAVIETIHGRSGRVVAIGGGAGAIGADVTIAPTSGVDVDPLARALVDPIVTALLAAELWCRVGAVPGSLG